MTLPLMKNPQTDKYTDVYALVQGTKLSPYKQKCVHKLLKYKDSLSGFDSLLGLPAFFGDAMRFGMIERLLSLG